MNNICNINWPLFYCAYFNRMHAETPMEVTIISKSLCSIHPASASSWLGCVTLRTLSGPPPVSWSPHPITLYPPLSGYRLQISRTIVRLGKGATGDETLQGRASLKSLNLKLFPWKIQNRFFFCEEASIVLLLWFWDYIIHLFIDWIHWRNIEFHIMMIKILFMQLLHNVE